MFFMVMMSSKKEMWKSVFIAPKWLVSGLGLPVPNSSTDLHSPAKLRTCLLGWAISSTSNKTGTDQFISPGNLAPGPRAGKFPFQMPASSSVCKGDPCWWWNLTMPIFLSLLRFWCLRFYFFVGSAGSPRPTASLPLLHPASCIPLVLSPQARLLFSWVNQVWRPGWWRLRYGQPFRISQAAVGQGVGFPGQPGSMVTLPLRDRVDLPSWLETQDWAALVLHKAVRE